MKISKILDNNITKIKSMLKSSDIIFFKFETISKISAIVIYIDGLSSKELIGEQIIKPLTKLNKISSIEDLNLNAIMPESKIIESFEEAKTNILDGNCVFIFEQFDKFISFGTKTFPMRAISEPPTSTVIKGPREGFVEDFKTNMTMLRRRLKTEKLIFETLTIGKYTNTYVTVCYIDGIVDPKILNETIRKLKKIDIDGIYDSSFISKFLVNNKYSLFKQIGNTEKPDILTSKLLEGRVGIIVDGSPLVLTLPYLLIEDFQTSEDYYMSNYKAIMSRLLRVIAVTLSIFLPAIFVAAQLFHLQLIPLSFLITIVNSIQGIPLSPSLEMFFTLLIFETLNEASIRMPRYVGMALSVVGALVLGETAVRAGIVSTPTIMIMALSGISMYTAPELVETLSVLRLSFLLIGGSIGGYGLILAGLFLLIYLVSLENFRTPILAPYSPLICSDLKDGILKESLYAQIKRPKSISNKNKTRMKMEASK